MTPPMPVSDDVEEKCYDVLRADSRRASEEVIKEQRRQTPDRGREFAGAYLQTPYQHQ
jgi:hypothetical protein